MLGRFGTALLGTTEFQARLIGGSRVVACVGDPASHSGSIKTSGQSGSKSYAGGDEIAVDGAIFACDDHGDQPISSIIQKTYSNGKLIVTVGAVAACGAVMNPPDRKVYAG